MPGNSKRTATGEAKLPRVKLPRGARDWSAAFLSALVETGHNDRAAAAAEIDRRTVWRRRQADPEFAKAYQEALRVSAVSLEAEAVRRARDGLRKVKFNTKTGEPFIDPVTGGPYVEHEYSDTLLLALLKRHFPESYRERQDVKLEHSGSVGVVLTEAKRQDLIRRRRAAVKMEDGKWKMENA